MPMLMLTGNANVKLAAVQVELPSLETSLEVQKNGIEEHIHFAFPSKNAGVSVSGDMVQHNYGNATGIQMVLNGDVHFVGEIIGNVPKPQAEATIHVPSGWEVYKTNGITIVENPDNITVLPL